VLYYLLNFDPRYKMESWWFIYDLWFIFDFNFNLYFKITKIIFFYILHFPSLNSRLKFSASC
jgi:hypothetical protein